MDDILIQKLINCSKIIDKKPKNNFKLINGSYSNDFTLIDVETRKYKFTVRLRQLQAFEENFSIMLDYYYPEQNKIIKLIRCNGYHGPHKNKIIDNNEFIGSHIHIATQEAFETGLQPEHYAISASYNTFNEAINYFWNKVKICDKIEKYFSPHNQLNFSGVAK